MTNNPHIGSSLDDFLSEECILQTIMHNLQGETMSETNLNNLSNIQQELEAEVKRKETARNKQTTHEMITSDQEKELLKRITNL